MRAAARLLEEAERPLLYVGGGAVISEASEEVVALMDRMDVPAVTTLMGKGSVPSSHPLNLGPVGMHGAKYSNMAMTEADVLIACGARFSDRVTGRLSRFAPNARIVHIDIDPAEIGKVVQVDVPIVGDLKGVLAALISQLDKDGAEPRDAEWVADLALWRERYPFYHPNVRDAADEVIPELVMAELGRQLDPERSIITTEVGQHQMWAHQFLPREHPRTFLSSGGLGTMGFGFPAALGAAVARPEAQVVCVAGDGSFQMNLQEMATATANGVPVKVMIMDNRCLGMVHQWQKLFYDRRYSTRCPTSSSWPTPTAGPPSGWNVPPTWPAPSNACSPRRAPTCWTWPSHPSRTSTPWWRRGPASTTSWAPSTWPWVLCARPCPAWPTPRPRRPAPR